MLPQIMMDPSVLMGTAIVEPRSEMEFESHEAAYAFYKDYAKSAGFGTAKLSSRRSRASREFIDAKFSCIRYGNKQQSDDAINPRPSPKIGCKASMHVKRRQDGKWYVYSFVKEHNHELLPAQAHFFRSHRSSDPLSNDVRIRRRKNSTAVSKLFSAYQNVDCLENFVKHQHDRGRSLALEAGHAQLLLELFMHMQEENPKFFYAVDLNEEHRLRNVFWVDAKGLEDFAYFADVVSIDTTYFTSNYKIPLVLFIGVNNHIQPTMLGCGLIADETVYTFAWLLQTWFIAMGERAPQVILTDQNDAIKAAVANVLPGTRHCFCLWHILEKIPKELEFLNTWHDDSFMEKFNKCVYKSWTEEQFEKRWWKLVDRFNLRDVGWVQSLYEDRTCWVPTFVRDISFAGLSTSSRLESLNSLFDNYVHVDTSLREFIEQYKVILEDRHEEEAKANFDAWHETPELRSPSPFEKQLLLVYTHEIYKKFQAEVLGAAACHLKKENDGVTATYSVKDFENNENYMVEWNTSNSDICCSCRSFEYKGYLCRHAIVVLQMSGVFSIPPKYILQRWTNAAMSRHPIGEKLEEVQSKVRRFNDLCRRAIILGEEGSLSQESYYIALGALSEAFKQCANLNNPVENDTRSDATATLVVCNVEEYQPIITSNNKLPDPKMNTSNKAVRTIVSGRDLRSTEISEGNKEKVPHLQAVSGKDDFQQMEVTDLSSHNVMPMQFHSMVPALFHNHNVSSTPFHTAASTHLHGSHLPR